MELVKISAHLPDNTPIEGISRGLIYYVYTGRNAWHSTWVTRYENGCMHKNLIFAKEYAERRRKRGTVFYITQLPCLTFRTKKECLLVTEINNKIPLSGFSLDAMASDDIKDSHLKFGSPIDGVVKSFHPNSIFWETQPNPKDSIIILSCKDPSLSVEKVNSDKLLAYESFSNGGKYYLGWNDINSNLDRAGILRIYQNVRS